VPPPKPTSLTPLTTQCMRQGTPQYGTAPSWSVFCLREPLRRAKLTQCFRCFLPHFLWHSERTHEAHGIPNKTVIHLLVYRHLRSPPPTTTPIAPRLPHPSLICLAAAAAIAHRTLLPHFDISPLRVSAANCVTTMAGLSWKSPWHGLSCHVWRDRAYTRPGPRLRCRAYVRRFGCLSDRAE